MEETVILLLLLMEKTGVKQKTFIYECRCDARLKTEFEGPTRLTYGGLHGEQEHLKIKTRLIDEWFSSVMGECVIVTL
jgi:hypothetical protein